MEQNNAYYLRLVEMTMESNHNYEFIVAGNSWNEANRNACDLIKDLYPSSNRMSAENVGEFVFDDGILVVIESLVPLNVRYDGNALMNRAA